MVRTPISVVTTKYNHGLTYSPRHIFISNNTWKNGSTQNKWITFDNTLCTVSLIRPCPYYNSPNALVTWIHYIKWGHFIKFRINWLIFERKWSLPTISILIEMHKYRICISKLIFLPKNFDLNSLSLKIWQFWSKSQTYESQDCEKDSTKADYTS